MNGERKNSDENSEHSSSKTPVNDNASTKANQVTDLQKKMKVLRDALIKEKQEKDIISKAKQALEK